MKPAKTKYLVFGLMLAVSCTGTQNMTNSRNTHFYTTTLGEAIEKTREALQEADIEIVNRGYESDTSYEYNVTVTRRGVAGGEQIQLFNGLVTVERVQDDVIRINVRDRISRPATVSSLDYEDYSADILRRLDEKLPAYTRRVTETGSQY